MKEIFTAMLHLQSALNGKTIGPLWVTSNDHDWFLAISQECAEGIDHLAWKWWSKQKPNITAAQMEVIDILHFALSAEMWVAPKEATIDDIADVMIQSYMNGKKPVKLDNIELKVADEPAIELFKLVSGLAVVGRIEIGLIFLLAAKLGLTPAQVTQLYQMKATLNLFRQNNGYKQGTYIKHWGPSLEDNAFLPILAEGIDWNAGEARELFYNRLNLKYGEVTERLAKPH